MRTITAPSSVRIVLLGLALACRSGAAFAQSDPPASEVAGPTTPAALPPPAGAPAPLTVDEAVGLAIRQNPRLTAAALEIAAAQAGVRSARALTNPLITFTPSLFGTGSDEELLLQQPLELNGTRAARTGIAQAQLRQTRATALGELRDLVFDTRSAYFELARAQELRVLAQEVLRTTEEFHRGVRRQAEEGLRPEIDPVQTEIEVNRARQQVTLAESQVAVAQASLNALLGQPAGEPVAAQPLTSVTSGSEREPDAAPPGIPPASPGGTGTFPIGPAAALPRETLTTQALAARAEIALEAAQRDQFRQEARLARAEGRPDLAPQFRTESILRSPRQPGVGIGITLPFVDWGSRRNRIRQAETAARAQEARIAVAQNQVRREVEQALARLRATEAVIRDYQAGVLDQSRRLRDASLRALQLGAPGSSILTVLEAQRTYRNVLTDYTNALAQHAQARAELERATGAVSADFLPVPTPSSRRETRR